MFGITLLGLCVALIALVAGQALEGGALSSLVQPSALIIVVGGTFGAVLIQSTPSGFLRALTMLRWIAEPPKGITAKEIQQWVQLADISKKQGIVKLEDVASTVPDPFMRKALQLVADNHPPSFIRERLEVELKIRDAQLRMSARVWESAAGYAPTIGILGSVLGLLHVMEGLKDPSRLGAGLAVAFVATVYGLVTANMLFLPVAHKLKELTTRQTLRDEMRIEAAVLLAKGESASRVWEYLKAFSEGYHVAQGVSA